MVFHPYTAHSFFAIILSTWMTYQQLVGNNLIRFAVHLAQRQQLRAADLAVQPDQVSVLFPTGTDKHTGAEVRGVVVVSCGMRSTPNPDSERKPKTIT